MTDKYVYHYFAAFAIVLVGTGVLTFSGAFDSGPTALATVDVPEAQPPKEAVQEPINDTPQDVQTPGSW
jgi:hypothetical protein